jgi:hypothetical protein
MKQIIFTAALIFAFCFAALAQTNVSQSKATKITEYEQDYGSEYGKLAIGDTATALQNNLNAEGVIKIQAIGNYEITRQLVQIKNLLKFRAVDLTRFSFAIRKDDKQIIQYWFVPLGENIPDCEDCIIIRAEDYDKLANFFNPKPKLKKRRK